MLSLLTGDMVPCVMQEKLDAEMAALEESFEAKKRKLLEDADKYKRELKKVCGFLSLIVCVFEFHWCVCCVHRFRTIHLLPGRSQPFSLGSRTFLHLQTMLSTLNSELLLLCAYFFFQDVHNQDEQIVA